MSVSFAHRRDAEAAEMFDFSFAVERTAKENHSATSWQGDVNW
jgi:hypothetical protein